MTEKRAIKYRYVKEKVESSFFYVLFLIVCPIIFLYFHLQDKSYFISNLNDRIIKHIRKNNCFIIEDLDHINAKMHLITL